MRYEQASWEFRSMCLRYRDNAFKCRSTKCPMHNLRVRGTDCKAAFLEMPRVVERILKEERKKEVNEAIATFDSRMPKDEEK